MPIASGVYIIISVIKVTFIDHTKGLRIYCGAEPLYHSIVTPFIENVVICTVLV